MLTVFCSMITHQQNHREQHNSFCSEEGQGESVALFFLLKHWERRPAADDSASVYFQLMMWQPV